MQVDGPAVIIRIRPGGHAAHDAVVPTIQGTGMLDLGAPMPVVPLWLIRKLGIHVSKDSKRTMYSVSGSLEVYEVDVGMDMQYGRRWLDLGAIREAAPDTEWSCDPKAHRPFLLGLGGFFDRFDMSISHAKKLFWLGKVGHRHGEERP